jgi:membrane-bound lytic murein transglycosylase B
MLTRRVLLSTAPFAALAHNGFPAFLNGLRAEAFAAGIGAATVRAALGDLRPNPKVLELDRHQPEFNLTWSQFRAKVLPDTRLQAAHEAVRREAHLLTPVSEQYGVDRRIVVAIWGLESAFGAITGKYGVVEALATLAYDGRRASYFRTEVLNALRILDHGDVSTAGMLGSWAGAMGQPQFMPSSYLRYAVDWDGDGRRDIWTNHGDVFASIANYLAKNGWRAGQPWGQPVRVPPGLAGAGTGRDHMRPLSAWMAEGVRRSDGTRFSRGDVPGAVVLPDGAGGEAFMVYANFNAIRRYNASDYYCLAVGLLANAAT